VIIADAAKTTAETAITAAPDPLFPVV